MLSKFLGKSPENANFFSLHILHRMRIFYINKIQMKIVQASSVDNVIRRHQRVNQGNINRLVRLERGSSEM
jgi:hypothetical protein